MFRRFDIRDEMLFQHSSVSGMKKPSATNINNIVDLSQINIYRGGQSSLRLQ